MNLPHSPEAERSLLSCFLMSPAALAFIHEVQESDLLIAFHRQVFLALKELGDRREAVDVVTLAQAMGISDRPAKVAELMDIAGAAPTWHNVRNYLDIVTRDGTARRLIASCLEFASRAHGQDPYEVLADARQELAAIEVRGTGGPVKLGERLQGVLDAIDGRATSPAETSSVGSGIASYDALIGPFRPGQLVVVAARPGIGKTAFAGACSMRAAKRGIPALVFSLEMTFVELAERFIGANARFPVEQLVRGVSGAAMRGLFTASGSLRDIPLWVDDRILTIGQIAATARAWRVKNPSSRALVVIDYLGLVKPTSRSETRALEVGRMAWGAKMLAKDLACPVMLVAQLNRNSEKDGRMPVLSDLRDSGEIEQHADTVIFPHREPPLDCAGPASLLVAKNRGGKTGKVDCYWAADFMTFDGLERREESDHGERRYADAAE